MKYLIPALLLLSSCSSAPVKLVAIQCEPRGRGDLYDCLTVPSETTLQNCSIIDGTNGKLFQCEEYRHSPPTHEKP